MLITNFMVSALAGSMGTGPGPMNGLLSLGRAGEETCTDWERDQTSSQVCLGTKY